MLLCEEDHAAVDDHAAAAVDDHAAVDVHVGVEGHAAAVDCGDGAGGEGVVAVVYSSPPVKML